MEYVSKINIFGLKMMVKSGLEYIFWQSQNGPKPFSDLPIHFIKGTFFALNYKFSNKNDFVCVHGGISNKKLVYTYVNGKWNSKPKISSIFHFEYVYEVWISGDVKVPVLNIRI